MARPVGLDCALSAQQLLHVQRYLWVGPGACLLWGGGIWAARVAGLVGAAGAANAAVAVVIVVVAGDEGGCGGCVA